MGRSFDAGRFAPRRAGSHLEDLGYEDYGGIYYVGVGRLEEDGGDEHAGGLRVGSGEIAKGLLELGDAAKDQAVALR